MAGSLVALSMVMFVGACGDDSGESTGSGGGGTTSSSNAGGAGGAGGGAGDCATITIPDFAYLGSGLLGGSYFGGAPSPAVDGAAEDIFVLEIWNPELSGTVDLGSATNQDYANCEACALVYADLDADQNPAKLYFQASGTLSLTSLGGGYYPQGSLSDVRLVEVTQDAETGALTTVADGACLLVSSQAIAIQPPVAGWECSPDYYEDGTDCDCRCGAVDPDCSIAEADIYGCYEGQTCSSDGSACEGTPTAWTCDPAEFGGGDGCDCNCGLAVLDPDCETAPTPAANCQNGESCNGNGACLPAAWTCEADYFGDGFACDCECGAIDPDCALPDPFVFGCEEGEVCNASGTCEPAPGG